MTARELRIGNWVEMYKKDSTPFKISASNIVVEYKTNKQGYTTYKPIPLTEEWLIKFGFKKNDKQLGSYDLHHFRFHTQRPTAKDNKFVLVTEIYFAKREVLVIGGVKHVHQLQNLYFALTGEELTIKQ